VPVAGEDWNQIADPAQHLRLVEEHVEIQQDSGAGPRLAQGLEQLLGILGALLALGAAGAAPHPHLQLRGFERLGYHALPALLLVGQQVNQGIPGRYDQLQFLS
jgi:hypothetical protein